MIRWSDHGRNFVGAARELSHALAYDKIDGFELVGLCSRSIRGRNDLPAELASLPRYENVDEALAESRPDAVSINTYPNTHEEFCIKTTILLASSPIL